MDKHNREALRSGAPRILPKREAHLKGIQGPQGNEEGPCPCGAKNFQGLRDGYVALLRQPRYGGMKSSIAFIT